MISFHSLNYVFKSESNYKRASKKNDPFLDSDDEGISSKKKTKSTTKRNPKTVPPARASTSSDNTDNASTSSEWLFGSDDEDVEQLRHKDQRSVSVLTRRVPGGVVRRTTHLDGPLLAELRLYNADDVVGLDGIERCEKALLWLKLQGDPDSPEFSGLKKVVNSAKVKFPEEGTFFADKKKK